MTRIDPNDPRIRLPEYQRGPTSKGKSMVWDPAVGDLCPIVLNARDEVLYVVDGQQRLHAARRFIPRVGSVAANILSLGLVQEQQLFVALNTTHTNAPWLVVKRAQEGYDPMVASFFRYLGDTTLTRPATAWAAYRSAPVEFAQAVGVCRNLFGPRFSGAVVAGVARAVVEHSPARAATRLTGLRQSDLEARAMSAPGSNADSRVAAVILRIVEGSEE